ncbi:30S ribosomal protein S3ae [Candidatus Micrarchaeota archaeon]|nr:30S ribosomal protein S3ae [Candidatus Micrarchaeota archaeon]
MVKKIVDTWKTKSWYSVTAPKFLNEVEVAQVIATDEEHLLNRIIKVPLKDITRDFSHVYTTLKLRVCEIKGKTAYTKFIGHEMAQEYMRALVRRRRDVLSVVFSTKSKDGLEFKIKAIILTNIICSRAQKTALRNLFAEELKKKTASEDFGQFIQDVLFGKVSLEMLGKLKKLVPIKKVEIRKTELKEEFDMEGKEIPKEQAVVPLPSIEQKPEPLQ